jgi:hypothetical protein
VNTALKACGYIRDTNPDRTRGHHMIAKLTEAGIQRALSLGAKRDRRPDA